MFDRRPRILLIVAPSLFDCHRTAVEFGLDPHRLCNFRNVTKALMLRGLSVGSPFIAIERERWGLTPDGRCLALMLDHLETTCRIRPLRADELDEYQERVPA